MSDFKHGGSQLAKAVQRAYDEGLDDYHLEPMVLTENGRPVGKIQDGDSVIFCCRRGEREVELTEMFTDPDFDKVPCRKLENLYFVIMTLYHDKFKDLPVAFAPSHVAKPLAQVLSEAGKSQFRIGKVRPRDLLFQRRRKPALPRRDGPVHSLPEGDCVRRKARTVFARRCRRRDRGFGTI